MSSNRQQQLPPPQQQQAAKRAFTLDFNSSSSNKRQRLAPGGNGAPPILSTPDVDKLKLASPELARFLSNSLATPTPSSNYIFPKTVTEEQELYAKGFEEALKNMHDGGKNSTNETAISTIEKATAAHRAAASAAAANSANNSLVIAASAIADQPPLPVVSVVVSAPSGSSSSRPGSEASGSLEDGYVLPEGVRVKKEDPEGGDEDEDDYSDDSQDDPVRSGSRLSPINMENQEKIKLERKRLRNRVAASKCRKRKLERIAQLDEKVSLLKGENSELAAVVKKLRANVCNLKQEVMEHVSHGCQIMVQDMAGSS